MTVDPDRAREMIREAAFRQPIHSIIQLIETAAQNLYQIRNEHTKVERNLSSGLDAETPEGFVGFIVASHYTHVAIQSDKSTLLNALLQCSLLPRSGKGAACTSVLTEIRTTSLFFVLYDKWLPQELDHLLADALEGEADDQERAHASPASLAREKLYRACIIVPC
ncbi:hypothetical protein B0H14DRAFT_2571726 [Mycena olivaceomarginata]|nr:hypothetical protein B0H14DRAFT_2571726 [Mycena olivaceomarginata]